MRDSGVGDEMTDDSDYDPWPDQVAKMTERLLPFVREWLDTMGNNYSSAFGINYAMEEAVRKVLRERGVKAYESRGE